MGRPKSSKNKKKAKRKVARPKAKVAKRTTKKKVAKKVAKKKTKKGLPKAKVIPIHKYRSGDKLSADGKRIIFTCEYKGCKKKENCAKQDRDYDGRKTPGKRFCALHQKMFERERRRKADRVRRAKKSSKKAA